MLHPLGLAVQLFGKRDEAREISVRILACFDAVLGIEEVRHGLIDAGELAHHVRRGPKTKAAIRKRRQLRPALADIEKRVVVHPVQAGEAASVDRFQARELARVQRLGAVDACHGFIAQPRLEARVRAFVEAEQGCALRSLVEVLLEEDVHQRIELGRFVLSGRIGKRRNHEGWQDRRRGGAGNKQIPATEWRGHRSVPSW